MDSLGSGPYGSGVSLLVSEPWRLVRLQEQCSQVAKGWGILKSFNSSHEGFFHSSKYFPPWEEKGSQCWLLCLANVFVMRALKRSLPTANSSLTLLSTFRGGGRSVGSSDFFFLLWQDCLECFFQPDTLTRNNQIHCYWCGGNQDATVKASITKAPQIIIFHLKRYSLSGVGYSQFLGNVRHEGQSLVFAWKETNNCK